MNHTARQYQYELAQRQLAGSNAGSRGPDDEETTFWEQFYIYEFESLGLAAAATSQDQMQIQSDADFSWIKSTFQADIASATQTDSSRVIPNATVQIRDAGSGRNFFDAPIPIPSFFGTGEIPFILPVKQILRLNTNLICEFVNFDAAATYDIRLALIGVKRFKTGPTPRY